VADERLRTWRVEGVLPKIEGRSYAKNVNIIVYALTLEEVVTEVRDKYPDITLYKVMGDRWAEDVLVVDRG
jgi:hypothetical protein